MYSINTTIDCIKNTQLFWKLKNIKSNKTVIMIEDNNYFDDLFEQSGGDQQPPVGSTSYFESIEREQKENAERLYKEYLDDIRRKKVMQQKQEAAEGGRIGFSKGKLADAARRKKLQVVSVYPKFAHARNHLNRIREKFELCATLCRLQPGGSGPCFHYHIKQCNGACAGYEPVEKYNERALAAREVLSTVFDEDFFIVDEGRAPGEYAVILVENGNFQGFGYLDDDALERDPPQLRDIIPPYPGHPETTRLIQRYLNKNPKVKRIPVPTQEVEW